MSEKEKVVYCSFCPRSRDEVKVMIVGDSGKTICSECVCACVDLISGRGKFASGRATNKAEVTP